MARGISIIKVKLGGGHFRVIEKTIDSSKPKCQVIGNRYVFNTEYKTLGTIREEPVKNSSTPEK